MRTPSQKAKSDSNLQTVIQATQKLWRRHHLSYEQTRYVAKQVRRALELEQPQRRTRIIERLSRDEERRLIDTAYRLTGTRGLLTLPTVKAGGFQTPRRRGSRGPVQARSHSRRHGQRAPWECPYRRTRPRQGPKSHANRVRLTWAIIRESQP